MAWMARISCSLKQLLHTYRRTSAASSQIRRIAYNSCKDLMNLNDNSTISSPQNSTAEHWPRARYRRRCHAEGPYSHCMHSLNIRCFSTTTSENAHEEGNNQKETISVTFVDKDGDEKVVKVPIGMSMLEAAHENDIELEGACEGSLACSTCHVIIMDVDYYNKLEEPTDEENDMLDLAFGLTETSRLGCQVIAKPELDGMRLALPAATRNFAVDGYVPKPH